jgi:hypothetical protein
MDKRRARANNRHRRRSRRARRQMSLPAGSLPAVWTWLALALVLWALLWSVRSAPWRQLHDGERLHVWLGSIVAVMLLRQIDATVAPGLTLHLLGATVLTLMFGLPLAIVALLAALAGGAAYAGTLGAALGPLALTTVLLPACVTEALRRAVGRWLPPICSSTCSATPSSAAPSPWPPPASPAPARRCWPAPATRWLRCCR